MDEIKNKLKTPAIGLLIAGIINASVAVLILIQGLLRLISGSNNMPTDEAEKLGFLIGTIGVYSLAVISLLVAPIIIFGAVSMMKGQKYGLAKTSSLLSIVPFTSCCFIVSIPIGIWAFITLRKPEIKEFFDRENS